MKDIKTKQKVQMIKTKDSKANIKHFIKQQTLHTRNMDNDTRQESISSNANVQATNSVKRTAKQTFIESSYRTTKFIKEKRNEHKIKKQNPLPNRNEIHPQKVSYISKAKQTVVNKVNASKVKQTSEKIVSTPVVQNTTKVIKTTYNVIKKSVSSIGALFSFGTGMILLLVLVLFIGTFGVLAQDGGSNSEIVSLSEEVIAYENTIRKYAKENDIEDYVSLIQAIMMQESGGKGNDPMQASESGYNTKYPRVPNGIAEAEYSIEVGVKTISDCIKKANVKDSSDTEHIYLALQGYNYGNGYIDWALEHFEGYTRANAKLFSDEMKAKLKVDVYGDPDYVEHVLRYYHIANGDIVAVAKSQVGNVGGKKYWKWYGFDSHVEWCAIFVSWCANESGDLNVSIPKFSRVEDGIQWFKDNKKWADKNYKPKSGDLIFFDWNNDNDPDHVGIVESSDNQYVYTIEGNSNDECREKKYSLINEVVRGYGMK